MRKGRLRTALRGVSLRTRVMATAALHAIGLGLALMIGRVAPKPVLRVIGGGIAAAGVAMVAAL